MGQGWGKGGALQPDAIRPSDGVDVEFRCGECARSRPDTPPLLLRATWSRPTTDAPGNPPWIATIDRIGRQAGQEHFERANFTTPDPKARRSFEADVLPVASTWSGRCRGCGGEFEYRSSRLRAAASRAAAQGLREVGLPPTGRGRRRRPSTAS